jgi:hypothetical protein
MLGSLSYHMYKKKYKGKQLMIGDGYVNLLDCGNDLTIVYQNIMLYTLLLCKIDWKQQE